MQIDLRVLRVHIRHVASSPPPRPSVSSKNTRDVSQDDLDNETTDKKKGDSVKLYEEAGTW